MPRKSSIFKIRGPKLRLTSKGLKVTKPSARIGGKAGINISSRGVSASIRTKSGTISSRRGVTLSPFRWLANLFKRK